MTKFEKTYKNGLYYSRLLNVLKNEGKRDMINDCIKKGIDEDKIIYHMIYNNYHLTTSDLWVLFKHFDIPTAFLSPKGVTFTRENKGINYVFIIVPKLKGAYKYIIDNGEILLDAEVFCEKSQERLINTFFYDYVHDYKKIKIIDS